MTTPLKSGKIYVSQCYKLNKNSKNVPIAINSVLPAKGRFLFEISLLKHINYYHKDTQISVSYSANLSAQIRIPGDTGIDYVIANAPP
jgi:hypothetical protein